MANGQSWQVSNPDLDEMEFFLSQFLRQSAVNGARRTWSDRLSFRRFSGLVNRIWHDRFKQKFKFSSTSRRDCAPVGSSQDCEGERDEIRHRNAVPREFACARWCD